MVNWWMLFERRLREGIHDGSITVMFRRWRRPQAAAGGHYRTTLDMIEVLDIRAVDISTVSDEDVRASGYPDANALVADLRGSDDVPVYRIEVRRLNEPDPRETLAADETLSAAEMASIRARLARMDAKRPWTEATLAAIAAHPDVVSTELAASLGMERFDFKRNVRKLKEMGLTRSQPVGYRLSPRGRAYLDAAGAEQPRSRG